MLDDSVLTAWAMMMQYYLAFSQNDSIIVFPVDLLKNYSGISLQEREYQNVRYFTKQFAGGFSIFRLVDQKPKILLFPIIKYAHFTLGVVIIKRDID